MALDLVNNGTGPGNGDGEDLYYAFEGVNNSLSWLQQYDEQMRQNLIVNGSLLINQRGNTGQLVTQAGTPQQKFFDNLTSEQGGPTDSGEMYAEDGGAMGGFRNSLKVTCKTADASLGATDFYAAVWGAIEGNIAKFLIGNTGILSFKFQANNSGLYNCFVVNPSGTYGFSYEFSYNTSSGVVDVSMPIDTFSSSHVTNESTGTALYFYICALTGSTYSIITPGSWHYDAGGSNWGTDGSLYNWMGAGNRYVQIAGIQLLIGDDPKPITVVDYGTELRRCQRYYWRGYMPGKSYGWLYATAGTYRNGGVCSFPVKMRADPTVSIVTAPTYNNCTSADLQGNVDGFQHRVDVTATGLYSATAGVYQASAELT